MFTLLGCKDKGIRQFVFVAKIQFMKKFILKKVIDTDTDTKL